MIKLNETYQYAKNGLNIKFSVDFVEGAVDTFDPVLKRVSIEPSESSGWKSGSKGFVFINSKPEVVKKIGQALVEIGEFVEKL